MTTTTEDRSMPRPEDLHHEDIDARNPMAIALYAYGRRQDYTRALHRLTDPESRADAWGEIHAYSNILELITGSRHDERQVELLRAEFPKFFPDPDESTV